jgi:hypothetical protein
MRGLGLPDLTSLSKVVDIGSKAAVATTGVIIATKAGTGSKQAATTSSTGSDLLASVSNSTLAIGSVAGLALLLAIMR